ncbi:NAD(P)/FAD-dependent oxidoreductase [Gracilibacillus caseinilyticus]|uniref:NAD(P)/FAD-dependent oxidoreductase n=1 Tax=Gracilibacillus caseinilyticus TaxID=2932256 RepID=A0ABY4ESE7_9BACI|nr:NAD(P)/FAD-dependent oxidoreductase [Gracilibacillus caseinilyticus]UOQ47280.1 NAD(P)/FAD-dependent oxidoreductase [Gracilibacillus caseinilyticus]
MTVKKPKIVVLGAGYAGMMTTKRLTQQFSPEEVDITLVNKHNYHYQTTWLHEVAAGTIDVNRSRIMISDVINTRHVNFVHDTVKQINKDDKTVELENGTLSYDFLVIGLGFEKATFGIPGMEEHAFSIQSVDKSRMIRDHIEYQFSRYRNEQDPDPSMLTIVVGGAGFTGIEFLGELAERIPALCKKYDIPRQDVKIIDIEAMSTILPGFDEDLLSYAKESLEARGIEFKLGTMIKEVKEDRVIVGEDREEIKTDTFVWTGGVQANRIVGESGFELTKGKVNVDATLRTPEQDDVFILGDCAWVMNEETGKPYPPTAQIAIQEADVCAHNIRTLIYGGTLRTFHFDNKGTVASLGGSDAMGTVFEGNKLYGMQAKVMKNVIDDRYLFMLGGPKLVLRKGKFRPF